MKANHHIVSLSLGTVAEPSALVMIQPRTEFSDPGGDGRPRDSKNYFDVTWIERFPAGRPIPAVVARACELISDKRLANNYTLLLDITSIGAAPARVFEGRGVYPTMVDLTNTTVEEHVGSTLRAPLRDAIGAAQVVLQTARLKVASELELAGTLVADLTAFDPKPVARNMDLRGGRNGDLVFALAVALWWGDRLTWGDEWFDMSGMELGGGDRRAGY